MAAFKSKQRRKLQKIPGSAHKHRMKTKWVQGLGNRGRKWSTWQPILSHAAHRVRKRRTKKILSDMATRDYR